LVADTGDWVIFIFDRNKDRIIGYEKDQLKNRFGKLKAVQRLRRTEDTKNQKIILSVMRERNENIS